jgi:ATP-dependent Clp protease protease subunit
MIDPHDPDEALRHRIVRLDGEITDAIAEMAIARLLYLEYEHPRQPVTLRIESPGGSVPAGMAVVDAVRGLRPPVHTRAPVMAHSMAAIILASGRKGERVVGPSAQLSLTRIEAVSETTVENLQRTRQKLADVIADLSGQLPRTVALHLLVGRGFTPEEAVSFGLADRIEV